MLSSPIATMFRAGYADVEKIRKDLVPAGAPPQPANGEGQRRLAEELASIDRTLKRVAGTEITRLERTLTFLATTGNASPFIGLFGTVWGIMDAFRQIGFRGSTSLAIVAPGISEALIATAVGLFAAIPAVVAYNYYLNKMRVMTSQMESFSAEFLNIVERHLKGL
jgi:biopolymer transport protein TolQ